MAQQRALIAMSGGVDSSVAAYLMQAQGYDCQGVTMRLYYGSHGRFHTCCAQEDIEDAMEVAFQLGIPYEVLDCTVDFRTQVMDKFCRVYEAGGTPNPCIDCNRYLKFDRLFQTAREWGMDYVVTGHYARIWRDPQSGRYLLGKGLDPSKDQSYVLYTMTQEQLAHVRFPLGDLEKSRVREIAVAQGLVNAKKHDSQDICFIPDGDYGAFLERHTGKRYPPGDFLSQDGQVLGQHRGAVRYTLGQRKGLGLALGTPCYVCGKDMAANTVTVGPEASLYRRSLLAEDLNWIAFDALPGPLRVRAMTRYRQPEQWATASMTPEGLLRLDFDRPQRAMTPGQAVVLYDGGLVLGGGTICRTLDEF